MKKFSKEYLTKQQIRQKQNKQLLDVYIRNNKKQALLVHINRNTQLQHISRAIQARFKIPLENQVLFHNGRTINSKNTQKLEDNSIVHVIDNRNITQYIAINVRRLNIPSSEQFIVSSSQIIQDFIVRHIRDEEPDKMFFVYTGRHLNRRRSFADQFVENESQLFCLHQERDEVKGERRQKYQRIIKQEVAEKQKLEAQIQQKQHSYQSDSGLENYLPKVNNSHQPQLQLAIQVQEIAPNFKKKTITKEINISSNQPNIKQTLQSEQNLSLMVQNNLAQHKSHANSGFFNQGSSISEIVPEEGQNPQNSKKNEEGIMFQSAFIGFSNQNSFINQNQGQSKINSANLSQQQDLSQHSQRNSFSFDVRAPQLINLRPDRHLTLIQRQILQVTQSEELSRQNVKQNDGKCQKSQSNRYCEGDRSIENCQFELGQIEKHELSASAEQRVEFNQKQSPSKPSPKNNQILIEDQDNQSLVDCQQPCKVELVPINQSFKLEQQKSNAQQEQVQQDLYFENQQKPEVQQRRQPQRDKSDKKISESQLIQECTTPRFLEFPQNNVDIYFIQQQNEGVRLNHQDQLEVLQQKIQCQTNGPSSSSNYQSKNSSRVKQSPFQFNQYEFGDYQKNFNSTARRSGYNEPKPFQNQDCIFDKSKSEISKVQNFQKSSKPQVQIKESRKYQDSLQIVQLSLENRAKKHSSLLLDQYNSTQELVLNGHKLEKFDSAKAFSRKDSKIEELINLISDLQEHKNNQNQDLLIQQSEISHVELQNNNLQTLAPDKDNATQFEAEAHTQDQKVETSLDQQNNQNYDSKISDSEQSLQPVQIKKVVNSYHSQFNFLQHEVKQNRRKQNFNKGIFIFRNQPNYFEPLQFYASLFQRDFVIRSQTTK